MRNLPTITCLVDNTASGRLWGEHGLAMLIETSDGRVCFDTGQSGTVLMHNLEQLQIDPQSIDALAISHAHYDHTGGLLTYHSMPMLISSEHVIQDVRVRWSLLGFPSRGRHWGPR